jgi:hypothetical protein
MKNPNEGQTQETLNRLKEESKERLALELKTSLESLMRDYNMTWDDLAEALGMKKYIPMYQPIPVSVPREVILKRRILEGKITLNDLNTLAHLFDCGPYILFRPRRPSKK